MIQALQYMMGIPIDGPKNMSCDNDAVVRYSTMPESILTKKNVSICYFCEWEACALCMMQIAKEGEDTNLADFFTEYIWYIIKGIHWTNILLCQVLLPFMGLHKYFLQSYCVLIWNAGPWKCGYFFNLMSITVNITGSLEISQTILRGLRTFYFDR